MGLDMYLSGQVCFKRTHSNHLLKPFPLQTHIYELGYWRKHPNLHGFIVETFARGVDKCQEIGLTADDLRKTIQAVKDRKLPYTDGFFFGSSTDADSTPEEIAEEVDNDIRILEAALEWVEQPEEDTTRSVSYQASW